MGKTFNDRVWYHIATKRTQMVLELRHWVNVVIDDRHDAIDRWLMH